MIEEDQMKQSFRRNKPKISQDQKAMYFNQDFIKQVVPNSRLWRDITKIINKQNKQNFFGTIQKQFFKNMYEKQQSQELNKKKQLKLKQMLLYLQETELNLQINYNNYEDIQQLYILLKYYLQYPLQSKVQKHIRANLLGTYDVFDYQYQNDSQNEKKYKVSEQIKQYCQCCSLPVQQILLTDYDKLLIYQKQISIWQIKNIGISDLLLFRLPEKLSTMLTFVGLIFCIYSVIVNKKNSIKYSQNNNLNTTISSSQNFYESLASYSMGSLVLAQFPQNKIYFYIQSKLILLTMIIWLIFHFCFLTHHYRMRYYLVAKKYQRRVSNFTLCFNNFPMDLGYQQLQKLINQYLVKYGTIQSKMLENIKQTVKQLKIKQLSKFNQTLKDLSIDLSEPNNKINNQVIQWLKRYKNQLNSNLSLNFVQKINKAHLLYYKEQSNKQKIKEQQQRIKQLRQYFQSLLNYRKNASIFIESSESEMCRRNRFKKYKQFRNLSKQIYQLQNDEQNEATMKKEEQSRDKLTAFVTFTNQKIAQQIIYINTFKQCFKYTNGRQAEISYPPQPEDIVWKYIGQTSTKLIAKILGIFLICFLILLPSFLILLILSILEQDKAQMKLGWHLPYVISIIIKISEYFLEKLLFWLTKFQKHWLYSNQQASIVVKTTIALLIQSIVIPLLISSYVNENFYGQKGLNTIVLTTLGLGIIFQMVSRWRIILCIFAKQFNKFKYTQKQYNQFILNATQRQFEIGYQYVQLIKTYLFTCFFIPLQPWLCLVALLYYFLIFNSQRDLLFHCKRPIPTNYIINNLMNKFVSLGPIFFLIGYYFFASQSYYYKQFSTSKEIFLSFIIAFIIFAMEFVNTFIQPVWTSQGMEEQYYLNYLNQFDIDYEMKNPYTSIQGRLRKFRINRQNTINSLKQKIIPTQQNPGGW